MARPRRPRAPRKPRAPRVAGERRTTVGAVGGGDLVQAAEEIADAARDKAAAWSSSVPASIRTEQVNERLVNVIADAPAAYPAETRSRHPLFGNRRHWYGPPGERFMGPAADERAGKAMARYADKIDRWARERGWR